MVDGIGRAKAKFFIVVCVAIVALLAGGLIYRTVKSETNATAAPTSTRNVTSSTSMEEAPEELALKGSEDSSTTDSKQVESIDTVPPTSGEAVDSSSTSVEKAGGGSVSAVPKSRGGAPVVTSGGGGNADVSIYTGFLGKIGRDEVVAGEVAAKPTVPAGVMPLTGLSGQVPQRPAAIVKIDNGASARPQSGLNAADIVYEEEVEGGVTRLAAVFHSTSSVVGPVRSGRTTDIGIMNGFGSPLFLYSGANAVTDSLIRKQSTVQNRNQGTSSGYWRESSRRAPSNLYTDTDPHWASASGGAPPAQFYYRGSGSASLGVPDSTFSIGYRANAVGWKWDGSAYLRSQGGGKHMDASGVQVSAANVVVVETKKVATGMVDASGSTVPEFIFVGSGKVTVFSDGKRVSGTWTRPTLAHAATLVTSDGQKITLTPGRTWVEVVEGGVGMLG